MLPYGIYLFEFSNENTTTISEFYSNDVILVSLLSTSSRFHKLCYQCSLWTSKCWLETAISQVDNVILLDGQGFLREHRSYIVKGNQNDTEYATDLLDANKDNTTLDFMLVSWYQDF